MGEVDDEYHPHCSSSSSVDSNANICSYVHDHKSDHPRSAASCSSSSDLSSNINTRNKYDSSKDLSTDLRLSLSISHFSPNEVSPFARGHQYKDWPPIKPLLRSTLAGKSNCRREESLFVKVYMDGIPIGRKLNLLAHVGYDTLITTLAKMFRTTIIFLDVVCRNSSEGYHILTYEDKDGDWMMVGDVPWELFLTAVRRLKIAKLEERL